MAENVPPSKGASGQAGDSSADQPGRPYYDSLRASLRESLNKKRKLDEQQAALEESIYKTESAYLEETANSGNIIRGFDGWVKGVQIGRTGVDDRRRARVRDEDRIFSRSSVSWMRVCIVTLLGVDAFRILMFYGLGTRRHRLEYPIPRTHTHCVLPTSTLWARLKCKHASCEREGYQ